MPRPGRRELVLLELELGEWMYAERLVFFWALRFMLEDLNPVPLKVVLDGSRS